MYFMIHKTKNLLPWLQCIIYIFASLIYCAIYLSFWVIPIWFTLEEAKYRWIFGIVYLVQMFSMTRYIKYVAKKRNIDSYLAHSFAWGVFTVFSFIDVVIVVLNYTVFKLQ